MGLISPNSVYFLDHIPQAPTPTISATTAPAPQSYPLTSHKLSSVAIKPLFPPTSCQNRSPSPSLYSRISRIFLPQVTCSPHADSHNRQLPGSHAGSPFLSALRFRGLVPIEFQLDYSPNLTGRLSPAGQLLMMCLQPTANAVVALPRPASRQLRRLYMIPASP